MWGGQRVLYAGSGRGRAAVGAARRGLRVTGLDLSPAMLERARQQAQAEGVSVEWIQNDAAHWEPRKPFDHVCANHFLNVFDADRMPHMRERLWSWVAPGGSLHIADFRPLHGAWIVRQAQRLHHWIPLSGCRALTGNAQHPIYDHDAWQPQALAGRPAPSDHRVWRIGPAWYRTWRFQKASS